MVTIEELNEVLKHAKNRKSCGLDNLPMELEIWRKRIKNTLARAV